MSSAPEWLNLIKEVAKEQDFEIDGENNKTTCKVFIDRWNAVAYLLKINSTGFIQAQQWESSNATDAGAYGRAVYSIRSFSDCVQFCAILIASAGIRAKRDAS